MGWSTSDAEYFQNEAEAAENILHERKFKKYFS